MSGKPRVLWVEEWEATDGGREYDFALELAHEFEEVLELLAEDETPVYSIAERSGVVQAIFTTAGEPLEEAIAGAVQLLGGFGVRVREEANEDE